MKISKRNSEVLGRDPSIGAIARDRTQIYKRAGAGTCNTPHPTRKETIKGVVHFLTCDRPSGHKVQHRAKSRGGYVWWS